AARDRPRAARRRGAPPSARVRARGRRREHARPPARAPAALVQRAAGCGLSGAAARRRAPGRACVDSAAMPRAADASLLALVAAGLLFGGGLGCEPVLQGVTLRPAQLTPGDFYIAFTGKKPPGTGSLELPYPLTPAFGVAARMGVFSANALDA